MKSLRENEFEKSDVKFSSFQSKYLNINYIKIYNCERDY